MKHRLISLIWVQLNMNFAISHSRYYYLEKRQRLWEGVLIVVSVIMTAAVLAFGVYKLADAFYSQASLLHQEALTLTTGILAAQFLMLILGIALVIAVFYFSDDLPCLIPLPLRPWEVLASKFAVILSNEYLGLFGVHRSYLRSIWKGESERWDYQLYTFRNYHISNTSRNPHCHRLDTCCYSNENRRLYKA